MLAGDRPTAFPTSLVRASRTTVDMVGILHGSNGYHGSNEKCARCVPCCQLTVLTVALRLQHSDRPAIRQGGPALGGLGQAGLSGSRPPRSSARTRQRPHLRKARTTLSPGVSRAAVPGLPQAAGPLGVCHARVRRSVPFRTRPGWATNLRASPRAWPSDYRSGRVPFRFSTRVPSARISPVGDTCR